jgi:hypothetical protein
MYFRPGLSFGLAIVRRQVDKSTAVLPAVSLNLGIRTCLRPSAFVHACASLRRLSLQDSLRNSISLALLSGASVHPHHHFHRLRSRSRSISETDIPKRTPWVSLYHPESRYGTTVLDIDPVFSLNSEC